MIVVDATVLLALVVQSPYSSRAAGMLTEGTALAVPQGALTEALSAAGELARLGHMSADDARLAAEVLPPLLAAIVPDTGLLPQAMELSVARGVSLPASLCLALAKQRSWPLASFDEALVQEAVRLGIDDAFSGTAISST